MPKYPEVKVELIGQDGNALAIIARVRRAMRAAGVDQKEVDAYMHQAMSGDYDHVLQVTMETVECE